MSTYVMSDIHGQFFSYRKMLKEIEFSDDDFLYVLGDCIDRGPDGISIIQDIMNRKNAELEKRRERLEQLIAEEEQRRTELEDEENYVQTRKYIEEKAKSIGYVYPDEIIFREDD